MDIKQLHSWLGSLESQQHHYRTPWAGVSKYICPSVQDTQYSGPVDYPDCHDSVGRVSAEIMANYISTALASRSIQWFQLAVRDSKQNQSSAAREYLQECTRRLYDAFGNSTFYSEISSVILSFVSFGAGAMTLEDHKNDGILRPQAISLYKCYCAAGWDGIVDTLFVKDKLSAHQIVTRWPKLKESNSKIKEKYEKNPFELIPVVHYMGRSDDWNMANPDHTYVSVWYLQDDQTVLNMVDGQYEGYHEKPFMVPRYATSDSSDVMGTGPGRKALPSLLALMKTIEIKEECLPLAINPPTDVEGEDNLISAGDNGKIEPGSMIVWQHLDKKQTRPFAGNIGIAELSVENLREQIEKIFFVNELKLSDQRPEMSAYEARLRASLIIKLLGPSGERLHSELINTSVERAFGILLRSKRFPEMPEELSEKTIDIESLNAMSIAQRSDEVIAAKEMLNNILPLAQVDPIYLELMDFEKYLQFIGERTGAPITVLRSQKEFQKIKAERDKQQQQMAQIQQAQEMATAAQRGARADQSLANAERMRSQA